MIGFDGWDAGALYDELKFDLQHADDFKRVATVGDNKWERVMGDHDQTVHKGEDPILRRNALCRAREWLSEGERCEDRAT